MNLFALSPTQIAGGQIALAALLAFAGILFLLPMPRGRSIWGGISALIAAATVFVCWLQTTYGNPMPDLVGTVMFWLFSLSALGFGTALVVQRNPARGAIAFAFVILSTCGLFLLLAAPFLMAATIIIYAGAIIVTFLFVLMLSQPKGASNENDRSLEAPLAALAGFAFVGLILFGLYLTYLGRGGDRTDTVMGEETISNPSKKLQLLPAPVLTTQERNDLVEVIAKLDAANEHLDTGHRDRMDYFEELKKSISKIVGVSQKEAKDTVKDGSMRTRLEKEPGKSGAGQVLFREDQQTKAVLKRAEIIRNLNWDVYEHLENFEPGKKGNLETIKAEIRNLRDEVLLLHGSAELPARNVENLGYILYADHLLAIELAGTLLLVATIGAIAIAQRKGVPA
jgi:NADH-quinone oxidoreductase subunit J